MNRNRPTPTTTILTLGTIALATSALTATIQGRTYTGLAIAALTAALWIIITPPPRPNPPQPTHHPRPQTPSPHHPTALLIPATLAAGLTGIAAAMHDPLPIAIFASITTITTALWITTRPR